MNNVDEFFVGGEPITPFKSAGWDVFQPFKSTPVFYKLMLLERGWVPICINKFVV